MSSPTQAAKAIIDRTFEGKVDFTTQIWEAADFKRVRIIPTKNNLMYEKLGAAASIQRAWHHLWHRPFLTNMKAAAHAFYEGLRAGLRTLHILPKVKNDQADRIATYIQERVNAQTSASDVSETTLQQMQDNIAAYSAFFKITKNPKLEEARTTLQAKIAALHTPPDSPKPDAPPPPPADPQDPQNGPNAPPSDQPGAGTQGSPSGSGDTSSGPDSSRPDLNTPPPPPPGTAPKPPSQAPTPPASPKVTGAKVDAVNPATLQQQHLQLLNDLITAILPPGVQPTDDDLRSIANTLQFLIPPPEMIASLSDVSGVRSITFKGQGTPVLTTTHLVEIGFTKTNHDGMIAAIIGRLANVDMESMSITFSNPLNLEAQERQVVVDEQALTLRYITFNDQAVALRAHAHNMFLRPVLNQVMHHYSGNSEDYARLVSTGLIVKEGALAWSSALVGKQDKPVSAGFASVNAKIQKTLQDGQAQWQLGDLKVPMTPESVKAITDGILALRASPAPAPVLAQEAPPAQGQGPDSGPQVPAPQPQPLTPPPRPATPPPGDDDDFDLTGLDTPLEPPQPLTPPQQTAPTPPKTPEPAAKSDDQQASPPPANPGSSQDAQRPPTPPPAANNPQPAAIDNAQKPGEKKGRFKGAVKQMTKAFSLSKKN